ncbi:calcium-binding protein [Campylobacter sp. RM16188]|uniref:calcium-binding protein n=1 Tax=Campylobacter sp. RM16188 TaxID=1705725 RepID=UPI001554EC2E|nr:calcium-binding protein [Campylobacter sp. RM16188]
MMLDTAAAKTYFGTSMDDNQKFIEHIYKNTLNKTVVEDAAGIKFWVDALNAGNSRGFIASELLKAAVDPKNAGQAQDLFNNKVAISDYTAGKVQNVASASAADLKPFVDALNMVTHDASTVPAAKAFVDTIPDAAMDTSSDWISTPVNPGETFTLTAGTDKATANVFNAPMTYNPAGTDRIKSLQDEDILTGTAGRTDNTLNVEMGQINADEGDGGVRTPQIHNIQNVNIQFTGNSKEMDLRYADSVNKVNIDKITKLTDDQVKVTNIGQKLDGMRVANASKATSNVTLDFKQGVLAGAEDSGLLELHNVLADKVVQTSNEGTGDKEGYEKLALISKAGVKLNELTLNQLKELTIKGSGNLTIAKLTNPATAATGLDQFLKLEDGGLNAVATTGLDKIDASGFNGKLTLDLTTVIDPSTNPFASGTVIPIEIIGGGADDVFYSKAAPTEKTKINGNGGNDKLVLVSTNIDTKDLPSITNIENLELRTQTTTAAKADLDAFKDDALAGVLVRNENMAANAAAEFELKNIKKALAESGNIVIEHSVDAMINENDTVNKSTGVVDQVDLKLTAILKDAKGDQDTLSLTVRNANNTQKVFNYDVIAAGVESITIDDQDTETNIVGLDRFADHKETITLKGGKAGQEYTVKNQLLSKVIDGSAQASNLRLQVGEGSYKTHTDKIIAQDIKLGKGDDILTFNNLNDFDSGDKISDAGGHDVVRAAFSKDSTLDISGIEELHIVATENVKLNMAKAEVEKLVIMSDKAVDQNQPAANDNSPITPEPFGIAPGSVTVTDIITIDGSKLNALNFFGDLDKDDKNGATTNAGFFYDDEDKAQVFNGVTLTNNKAEKLDININSSLDKVFRGAETYDIGQITAHGSKEISIVVKDEYYKLKGDDIATHPGEVKNGKGVKDYSNTKTTIHNIFADTMSTLTVEAQANIDLNVVSGAGTRDNVTKVDATKVGGNFIAHVKALGNGATVNLGDATSDKTGAWTGNIFSGYTSNGTGVNYEAGNGNNRITGNNKDDNIKVGNGLNLIFADQGNNKVITGDGNDLVNALAGNDTIVLGKGNDIYVDNINLSSADFFEGAINYTGAASGTDAGTSSTTVTKTGDAGMVFIHAAGDDVLANAAVKQWIAVGEGGKGLQLEWEGDTLKTASATLDGASKLAAVGDTDANANLFINEAANAETFDGKAGNDVYLSTKAASAVNFSGGEGNDAVVGGNGNDLIKGGEGADVAVLQHKVHDKIDGAALIAGDYDGKTDVVTIAMGDSKIDSWDKIYMFDSVTAANAALPAAADDTGATAGGDVLKLKVKFDATKFAGNEAAAAGTHTLNGNDVGGIMGHSVEAAGLVTFKSLTAAENNTGLQSNYNTVDAHTVASAGTEVKINASNLKDALAYLAKYYDGTGATVMFRYDGNNDGNYGSSIHDSVFVFQDGEQDTVVELVGVPNSTITLTDTQAANSISVQQ